MDKINLILIVAAITIFISLLLALFLTTVKTDNKLSNRLFSMFLILLAIDTSGVILDAISTQPTSLLILSSLMAFLQLPVFYLYVVSVCYSDFELKPIHLLHGLPFLIVNLLFLPRFYLVDLPSKINFLQSGRSMIEFQFSHVFIHLQIIIYVVAVFMILRKTKKLYLENYAGISLKTYDWLFQFTLALAILYATALFKNIFKFSDYPNIEEWLKIGLHLFELVIICWYLLKALNNPNLFKKIDSSLKLIKDIVSEKMVNPDLMDNEKKDAEDLSKIEKYMREEKPYLNPSLTIRNISEETEIPVRDLSILINHRLKQHFYDFVNSYRIEKAMDVLKDVTKSKVTILEILYEVGFNSKSSFNTAFKKHTGTTPTAYRKSQ